MITTFVRILHYFSQEMYNNSYAINLTWPSQDSRHSKCDEIAYQQLKFGNELVIA